MLTQQDVVDRRPHDDTVSFGGWAIDLHPSEGVYSPESPCTQWHSKGVYPIPYRCLYSRNIHNLFLAGRIISASHIAFGSTRVMGTCAHNAQAVAIAAAHCKRNDMLPRDLVEKGRIEELQRDLLRTGQHLPGIDHSDDQDLAESAEVSASSTRRIASLEGNGQFVTLDNAVAQMFPVKGGAVPVLTFYADADESTELRVRLMSSATPELHTPEVVLAEETFSLSPASERVMEVTTVGQKQQAVGGASTTATLVRQHKAHVGGVVPQRVRFDPRVLVAQDQHLMLVFDKNPGVAVALTDERPSGLLALAQKGNGAVSKGAIQDPPQDAGIERFEFWLPERRPGGKNLAMRFDPPLDGYTPENIQHGPERPTSAANAWSASPDDSEPCIELKWNSPQTISRINVAFDTDADHPMESVLMGHPERVMPNCVRNAAIFDDSGNELGRLTDNHQTRWTLQLDRPVTTKTLRVVAEPPAPGNPPVIFRVRCFA